MTENEAKAYMEDEIRCIQRASYCDRDCAKCPLVKEETPLLEAFGVAITALEEIQAYRAIGTVEECKNSKIIADERYDKAIDEFAGMLEFSLMNNYRYLLKIDADEFEWLTTDAVLTHIRKVKEQLKGGAE